jgi:hypothetical protein
MGDIEDKFLLLLSANVLSLAVLELFLILVAKLTMCSRFCVNNKDLLCFLLLLLLPPLLLIRFLLLLFLLLLLLLFLTLNEVTCVYV